LLRGDSHFRDVSRTLWDVEERLRDLDRAGLAAQLISPVPVTFAPWAAREAAVHYASAVTESVRAAVHAGRGRLHGLGAVPLPHVADSVRALEDLMTGPAALRGVEISSRIGELDLDDPRLTPFMEAAEALGALVLVHPPDGGGGTLRRSGQPYDFGLGMLTDTALAAGALVFGGVLDRFPRLQVLLAHGCGTFAWAYPRMKLGAALFSGADTGRLDAVVERLWVDNLVLDTGQLRLLEHRFGAERVVLGTDHPFFPAITASAGRVLAAAEQSGALAVGGAQRIFSTNGGALLAARA
jgi:aminocarboxymuconate-semialdehyde decarboxylase